ncbi:hypothetical protein CCACVL1_11442 [Corchorus capsularis]|uniref:Uncharacterized protein n=1 Tax=Corchorus capsularis TaxID=210143 RepID=A0A1R3IL54_COCAP|nr:hypothetical protein CCACVL1_11442 [Corchorus capsularis]
MEEEHEAVAEEKEDDEDEDQYKDFWLCPRSKASPSEEVNLVQRPF